MWVSSCVMTSWPQSFEMKDVGQLVRDDELAPVIRVAKRRFGHRRVRVDDDAVRGVRRGRAVRFVDVVGEDDVDGAARRMELLRQLAVRALGVGRNAAREWFGALGERDAKVRRLEGDPVVARVDLGVERWCEQQCHPEERRDEGSSLLAAMPATSTFKQIPRYARNDTGCARNDRRHRANVRKYASTPSATPIAYRS
jgi:hypothetical protein